MVASKKHSSPELSLSDTLNYEMQKEESNRKLNEKSANQDLKSQQNFPKTTLNQSSVSFRSLDTIPRQYISPHTEIQDHTGNKCAKRKAFQRDPDEPKLVYGSIVIPPQKQFLSTTKHATSKSTIIPSISRPVTRTNRSSFVSSSSEKCLIRREMANKFQQKIAVFRRCNECVNCKRVECGQCKHCLDMPKFGGTYKLKKACVDRECVRSKEVTS